QAEDGIRDFHVTGVQTCALPILWLGKAIVRELSIDGLRFGTARSESGALPDVPETAPEAATKDSGGMLSTVELPTADDILARERSEERRVGKECRSGWEP